LKSHRGFSPRFNKAATARIKHDRWPAACYTLCDNSRCLQEWKRQNNSLPIQSIIVDEVQDCTVALIRTFISAASNPNCLFLAGDTCQTIARGVGGFRFEDVRNLFFAEQTRQLQAGGIFEGDRRLATVPPLLQLATNYRSHNGILGCANLLVTLLVSLFPSSIDRLRSERSPQDGAAPVLLPDTRPEELWSLLHGTEANSRMVGFGANQVRAEQRCKADSRVDEHGRGLDGIGYCDRGVEPDELHCVPSMPFQTSLHCADISLAPI
jgi:hypothetical protein